MGTEPARDTDVCVLEEEADFGMVAMMILQVPDASLTVEWGDQQSVMRNESKKESRLVIAEDVEFDKAVSSSVGRDKPFNLTSQA